MTQENVPGPEAYDGPLAGTQSRFAVYNCKCGNRFALEVFTSLNLEERADLVQQLLDGNLNRGACPNCGETVSVDARCVLHEPRKEQFVLVLPESERHRELEARAEMLMELAGDPGKKGLPDYVIEFDVVFGPGGLRTYLRDGSPKARERAAAREAQSVLARQAQIAEREEALRARDEEMERLRLEVEAQRTELAQKFAEVEKLEEEIRRQGEDVERRRRNVEEFSRALDERMKAREERTERKFPKDVTPVEPPVPEPEPPATSWFSAPAAAQDGTNLEQTVQAALPEFDASEETSPRGRGIEVSEEDVIEEAEIVDEEAIAPAPAAPPPAEPAPAAPPPAEPAPAAPPPAEPAPAAPPRPRSPAKVEPGTITDEVREGLRGASRRHMILVGQRVELFTVTTTRSVLDGVKSSAVRFRVHLVEDDGGYPYVVVSAALRAPSRELLFFKWLLDYQVRVHRRILGRLGERCSALVTLVSPDLDRKTTIKVSNRIEGNIKSIASELEQRFLREPDLASPGAPDENAVVGKLIEELKQPMPFHGSYVEEHGSPAGVLAAIDDVETWSGPEMTRRLVHTYSYPLEALARIKRRVLARAVEMGLDLPGKRAEEAVSMGLAADETALLSHSLRAFLTLCRDEHDLEREHVAANWKRLLEAAARRGVPVDVEVAEMAADWLEDGLPDLPCAEEVRSLDATPPDLLDDEVLLRWLWRPARRADAALTILGKGGPEAFEAIAPAVQRMDSYELLQIVPRILEDAEDESENFFMDGLKSPNRDLRIASALALGKQRLRAAIVPLINAICEHEEPDWKIECIVLARYGVAAIRTVEQFLRNPRGCEDRLAFLTAALAEAGCEDQVRALTSEPDLMVASLAKKALESRLHVKGETAALLEADSDDPLVLFAREMDVRLRGD